MTGSRRGCRCSARPTPRAASGPCGSRPRGYRSDGAREALILGIAELVGTATAAVASAMVSVLAAGDRAGGVITTSDADVPTRDALDHVTRHGVRLQSFTGIPS